MKLSFSWKIYALLAAITDASMGVFNKTILESGFPSEHVAFYACFLAFLVLTLFIFIKEGTQGFVELFNIKKAEIFKIAMGAIFGVFVLYFFETRAYVDIHMATVLFIILGISTITTVILARFFLGEKLTLRFWGAMILSVVGLYLIFQHFGFDKLSLGTLFSAIAGTGYGAFLVLTKKSNLEENNFKFLWWFLGFGSVYLFIPFFIDGFSLPPVESLFHLLLLALIPTLGTYYFTVKALSLGKARDVQIIHLSDPLFAALFGFIVFGEVLDGKQLIGACVVFLAICLVELPWGKNKNK